MTNKRFDYTGFTLIELLVVIAIIAILAAIVAPNAFRAIEKGKVAATIRDYRSIESAATAYFGDTGQWPGDQAATVGFVICPTGPRGVLLPGWDGPYLEKWPRAKWGGEYLFRVHYDGQSAVGGFDWAPGYPMVRVLSIPNVPSSATPSATTAAGRIDMGIDGAVDPNAGIVRYALTDPTTVYILVARD